MPNITTFLWFDTQAEEAANYYCGIFPNSKVTNVSHYSEEAAQATGRQAGSVLTADFELDGKPFAALNGGPVFKFTEAISLAISCRDQAEIDHYWNSLTADGGEESMCGWLKDRYGLSWQVIPAQLAEWMKDATAFERVMSKVMEMRKLDYAVLEAASRGA